MARGTLDGTIGLSPCEDRLVLSRGGEYFVLDLDSLAETPLAGVPPFSGQIVAVRTTFPRGDINGDGRVTPDDVHDLLDYLFSGGSLDGPGAADANRDGLINFRDVQIIVRHLWASIRVENTESLGPAFASEHPIRCPGICPRGTRASPAR